MIVFNRTKKINQIYRYMYVRMYGYKMWINVTIDKFGASVSIV